MADFYGFMGGTAGLTIELANRWFQPLTHVSNGGLPRKSAAGGQRRKREGRDLSGTRWHNAWHSLFGGCSS